MVQMFFYLQKDTILKSIIILCLLIYSCSLFGQRKIYQCAGQDEISEFVTKIDRIIDSNEAPYILKNVNYNLIIIKFISRNKIRFLAYQNPAYSIQFFINDTEDESNCYFQISKNNLIKSYFVFCNQTDFCKTNFVKSLDSEDPALFEKIANRQPLKDYYFVVSGILTREDNGVYLSDFDFIQY
jgi:hypothetical protein